MEPTTKIKKLSIRKTTVKNLTVRAGLQAGGPCDTTAGCTIDCYKSCEAGAATLCKAMM
jgi:hypothetical protein